MKNFGKALMNKAVVAGVTRHGMTAVGGWLMANGYATAGQVELLTGGAVALAGVIWSARQKRQVGW